MAKKQTNPQKTSFETLLADFKKYMTARNKIKEESRKSYSGYLTSINQHMGNGISWLINSVIKNKYKKNTPEEMQNLYKEETNSKTYDVAKKTMQNWGSALGSLGEFIFGHINAQTNIESIENFNLISCKLVAQSAIFCSREVFERVKNGELGSPKYGERNNEGAWYAHKYKRAHANENSGCEDSDVILDDNTYANHAIKYAICADLKKYGISISIDAFEGFEACHIWDETCYNKKYHTSVANIVLLPRSIASLTDHCDAVKKLLQYEAWRRFGFKPEENEYYKLYSKDNTNFSYSDYPREEPLYYDSIKWKYPLNEDEYTNKRIKRIAKKST